MPVWQALRQTVFFAGILLVPVLIDGAGDAHQPVAVFHEFQQVRRCKKLDAVRRWIAEGFEQPGGDEHRNVMRLTVEHPRRLLRREAGWQLAQQQQKPMLVISHFISNSIDSPEHHKSCNDVPGQGGPAGPRPRMPSPPGEWPCKIAVRPR
jgi:hypothetical protein